MRNFLIAFKTFLKVAPDETLKQVITANPILSMLSFPLNAKLPFCVNE